MASPWEQVSIKSLVDSIFYLISDKYQAESLKLTLGNLKMDLYVNKLWPKSSNGSGLSSQNHWGTWWHALKAIVEDLPLWEDGVDELFSLVDRGEGEIEGLFRGWDFP